jgi:colicin import membrane protein
MAARARRIEEEAAMPANDSTDIVRQVEDNPALVLTDETVFETYYAHVEQQALQVAVDLSTSAGRDRIRSAASEVARKKTAFDKARKELTEDYRRKTATINTVGKVVVDRFAALQLRVRQPLTDWEEREEARKAEADLILTNLRDAAIVRADETAEDVERRLERIRGINLNDELFGPRIEMAVDLRDDAVKALGEALARLKQQEADRAELERLRRVAREREEQEARERQEAEDRRAEEQRKAEEQRRADAAAEQARKDAEEAAARAHQEELNRIEREKQAEIDAANERARKAEEEAAAERKRIADEKAAAEAEARREAEAKAKREADQEHRTAVRRAAKEAIMSCGADEETARKIVLAIQAGEVPAVRIEREATILTEHAPRRTLPTNRGIGWAEGNRNA